MNWLLCWKVVLAAVAIAISVNAIIVAVRTTRDAIHVWKAPRSTASK
jgi:hypothetical protein